MYHIAVGGLSKMYCLSYLSQFLLHINTFKTFDSFMYTLNINAHKVGPFENHTCFFSTNVKEQPFCIIVQKHKDFTKDTRTDYLHSKITMIRNTLPYYTVVNAIVPTQKLVLVVL